NRMRIDSGSRSFRESTRRGGGRSPRATAPSPLHHRGLGHLRRPHLRVENVKHGPKGDMIWSDHSPSGRSLVRYSDLAKALHESSGVQSSRWWNLLWLRPYIEDMSRSPGEASFSSGRHPTMASRKGRGMAPYLIGASSPIQPHRIFG